MSAGQGQSDARFAPSALRGERPAAALVLSDGTVFEGEAIGSLATGEVTVATGEVVFNTAMSGYQEIITDPSYAGQVIAFTYPHIGNYGVTRRDDEATRPFCRGIITRTLAPRASSWRSEQELEAFLATKGIGGLTGVDTRRLTRHIREAGAMSGAFGTAPLEELFARAKSEPGTLGADLVKEVTTARRYLVPGGAKRVVAYDFGIKSAILRRLTRFASVEVVPASTSAEEVLALEPDGIFCSNGPGDPAALTKITAELKGLLGEKPIFGICLGHQLLGAALGGRTYKLAFGHHGANHPVKALKNGTVQVTSQNHGYALEDATIEGAIVTHVNLNDGVIEGFSCQQARVVAVQYHPEAGPGPHDATYLFDEFEVAMGGRS